MFKGMDGFVNSKTVVGEPVKVGDATLIPLIEVSCGMGAGGYVKEKDAKNGDGGAGALSSKITPTAILVLQNGNTKLVNIKNQDTMTKILDMVPDVIDRLKAPKTDKMIEEDVVDILDGAEKEAEKKA